MLFSSSTIVLEKIRKTAPSLAAFNPRNNGRFYAQTDTETAFTPQMKLYQSSDMNFHFWIGNTINGGHYYDRTEVRLSDVFERYDSRTPYEHGVQPFGLSGIANCGTWPRGVVPVSTPSAGQILNNQNYWDVVTDVSGTVTVIPIGTDRNQYTKPPSGGDSGVNPL